MPRETLTREMACKKIRCGRNKLYQLEKEELFPPGTFFTIGVRKYFFADMLDKWLSEGGELGARLRRENSK
ncbi:MAG: hypothetical protein IJN74_00070 [Clostridia bacterium]|nr:hypothetical protein [Clostridia bacterium]